jgi:hypothetical protein
MEGCRILSQGLPVMWLNSSTSQLKLANRGRSNSSAARSCELWRGPVYVWGKFQGRVTDWSKVTAWRDAFHLKGKYKLWDRLRLRQEILCCKWQKPSANCLEQDFILLCTREKLAVSWTWVSIPMNGIGISYGGIGIWPKADLRQRQRNHGHVPQRPLRHLGQCNIFHTSTACSPSPCKAPWQVRLVLHKGAPPSSQFIWAEIVLWRESYSMARPLLLRRERSSGKERRRQERVPWC